MKKKVFVITGSRAEYGLLQGLIKRFDDSNSFDLKIIVSGMHLLDQFGGTAKEIKKDGYKISHKVYMDLKSDSEKDISYAISKGIKGFSDIFEKEKPSLVIVLGDRFEIFSAAVASMIYRIPIAHLHGGESTETLIDEPIRHSITKMSHLHFTSTEQYRDRVIQLGENPSKVFNVGAIGIDNIFDLKLHSKKELENIINFKFNKTNLLVTYHPVTLEKGTSKKYFKNLLRAINSLPETNIILTKANADMEGDLINELIEDYTEKNPTKSVSFSSMGQVNYLSAMKYVDGVVGNSSSGIIEAPSLKVGTLNIGNRQKGRIKATSIINCGSSYKEIQMGLEQLLSAPFKKKLSRVNNPYGKGGTAEKIFNIINNEVLEGLLKKEFFDLTKN